MSYSELGLKLDERFFFAVFRNSSYTREKVIHGSIQGCVLCSCVVRMFFKKN